MYLSRLPLYRQGLIKLKCYTNTNILEHLQVARV